MRTVVVVVLAGLGACGVVSQARDHARTGQWAEAVADYDRAIALHPGRAVLRDERDEARALAIGGALAPLQEALGARDLVAACAAVQEVARVSGADEAAAQARVAVGQVALATVDAEDDPVLSLSAARAAETCAPRDAAEAVGRARADLTSAVDRLLAAARPADATRLATRALEVDREAVTPLVQRARGAWASALRSQAVQAEASGQLGLATLSWGALEALGLRAEATAHRAELRRRIVAEAGLPMRLVVTGEPVRSTALRERVDPLLAARRSVRWGEAEVAAEVVLGVPRCDTETTVEVASRRYVAGTRMETNPDRLAVEAAAAEAERRLSDAEAGAADAAVRLERRVAEVQVAAARAADAGDDLVPARDRLRAAREDLVRALGAARSAVERGATDPATAQGALGEAAGALRATGDGVVVALDAIDDSADAAAVLAPLAGALRVEVEALYGALQDVAQLRRWASEAWTAVSRTPVLVEVQDWATFDYGVDVTTRTCTSTARLSVSPGVWELDAAASSTDRSHPAHPRYGVDQDPLRLDPDGRLIGRADAELAVAVARRLDARITAWAESRWDVARTSTTAEGRARATLLGAWAGLDVPSDLAGWLRQGYGIDDVASLR